jgi:hypothetical protein
MVSDSFLFNELLSLLRIIFNKDKKSKTILGGNPLIPTTYYYTNIKHV